MNAKEMFAKLGYKQTQEDIANANGMGDAYVTYENEDDGLRIIFERYKWNVDVAFFKIHSTTANPITIVSGDIIEAVSQQLKEIKEKRKLHV